MCCMGVHICVPTYVHVETRAEYFQCLFQRQGLSLTWKLTVFPKLGLQHMQPCLALTCRGFELNSPDLLGSQVAYVGSADRPASWNSLISASHFILGTFVLRTLLLGSGFHGILILVGQVLYPSTSQPCFYASMIVLTFKVSFHKQHKQKPQLRVPRPARMPPSNPRKPGFKGAQRHLVPAVRFD